MENQESTQPQNTKPKELPPLKKRKAPFLSFASFTKEKDYFIENLAFLLGSGIDLLRAVDIISMEIRTAKMIRVLGQLREDIDSGFTLWRALTKSKLVDEQSIELIKIGEESGRLSELLKVVIRRKEKERLFRSRLISAMLYPAIVIAIGVLVGIGIMFFVLPNLSSMYERMNIDLPILTRLLIAIGKFMADWGHIAIPVFLVLSAFGFFLMFIYKKTRFIGQAILFRTPKIKNLILEVEMARFNFILGTLIKAGIPVVFALKSLESTASFRFYKKLYAYLADQINDGFSFQESFEKYPKVSKYVPFHTQQMIMVAERAGTLDETLLKAGKAFEIKNASSTKNLTTALEPLMLIVVWVGVAVLALGIVLPIYSLIGNVGGETSSETPVNPAEDTAIITTKPSPTPTPTATLTDTPTPSPTPIEKQVRVLPNEVGTLNVRERAGTGGKIITKIKPGEVYPYTEETNGWTKITLPDGKTGWVSSSYVEKIN